MKRKFIIPFLLLITYVIFTFLLRVVDRQAVGPDDSIVGFATINSWFHSLTGVNWTLYNITDWGGVPPIIMGMHFGFIGLIQWIKRKSILKVDIELTLLGIFYILVFLVYLLFEFMVINRRPVLINNYLEASYPSSTTFLSITFLLTSHTIIKKYINNKIIKNLLLYISTSYMLFLIFGRAISGVHWLTDIVGSIFLGLSMVYFYEYSLEIAYKIKKQNHQQVPHL